MVRDYSLTNMNYIYCFCQQEFQYFSKSRPEKSYQLVFRISEIPV